MNSLDFVHRWYMPFLWFAASCAATMPLAVYWQLDLPTIGGTGLGLAYGDAWVLRDEYLETIVPYLMSLVAGVWLIDGDGTTRWAAFWALLAGIARIAVPLWIVTVPDVTAATGQHYIDWQTLRPLIWFADVQMALLGVTIWAIFGHFAGSSRGFHSAHHEPAY
jgi:hypothetical protein